MRVTAGRLVKQSSVKCLKCGIIAHDHVYLQIVAGRDEESGANLGIYWTKAAARFFLRTPQRNRNELGETTVNKTRRKHPSPREENLEDTHCVRDAGNCPLQTATISECQYRCCHFPEALVSIVRLRAGGA
jgi:hypothetical protein